MKLGYVLNVHDALNYDIDIQILSNKNIITYEYKYLYRSAEKYSRSVRCRLKGIKFNPECKNSPNYHDSKVDIIKWIDRCDGWVEYSTYNVDMYNRVIVVLKDPVTKELFSEFLLRKYPDLFIKYSSNE